MLLTCNENEINQERMLQVHSNMSYVFVCCERLDTYRRSTVKRLKFTRRRQPGCVGPLLVESGLCSEL